MALKATIFKSELQISDMDRQYYQTHALTMARHPSETDERMMLRLLAFALFADERLEFTKGLSSDDEPELWQKNYSDEIELWIDLGQLDERRIRKACGRAQQVVLISYGGRTAEIWWQQVKNSLHRFDNLRVLNIPPANSNELESMAQRSMRLQCTIDSGHIWLSDGKQTVEITPERWK